MFIKRLALAALTIVAAATISFAMARLSPIDPVAALIARVGSRASGESDMAQLVAYYNQALGLNEPLLIQYLKYLRSIFTFDFGFTLTYYPSKVGPLIQNALPYTLVIFLVGNLLAFIVGNLFASLATWPSGSPVWRYLTRALLPFSATPLYIIAILLLFVFAVWWPVLPLGGIQSIGASNASFWSWFLDTAKHMVLPIASVTLGLAGFWALSMRGAAQTALGDRHIEYAKSMGMKPRIVFYRYYGRAAIVPQFVALSTDIGVAVSGQVVVEAVYRIPGIGTLLFDAIQGNDFFVIQGCVFVIILIVVVSSVIVDLLYPYLDPRVRR